MSRWTAEATVGTAGRVDAATAHLPAGSQRISRREVHACGSQGVSVRVAVEAGTVAAAHGAAPASLHRRQHVEVIRPR